MKNPDHDNNLSLLWLFSVIPRNYICMWEKKNVNCTFLSLNDFDTLLETSNYSLMNTIW